MHAVILAGGLGTRLLPITRTVPKAMVPICGRPFLEYQLELLRIHGITDIVLCIGYLGGVIKTHLLGTAGALKNVEHCLPDEFFVTYGDAYLMLDYQYAMAYFLERDRLGLMVTYRNRDRYDCSNVIVKGSFVVAYDKHQKLPGMEYIDFGVALLRKEALRHVPPSRPASLEELYARLIGQGQLLAYLTHRRFYEIGSHRGLAEFEALVRAGRIHPAARSESLPVAQAERLQR